MGISSLSCVVLYNPTASEKFRGNLQLQNGSSRAKRFAYAPARSRRCDLRRLAAAALLINLQYASDPGTFPSVSGKLNSERRSGCPVSISLETFGDRWSLLIIRDLMVRGFSTFKQFHASGEAIATNILAHRLKRLEAAGIITGEIDQNDGRSVCYRLTEKGIDLAPVLLDLLIWGARHENTAAPCAVIEKMARNRREILAEVRRRWQERDPTPLLPRFSDDEAGGSPPTSGDTRRRAVDPAKRRRRA